MSFREPKHQVRPRRGNVNWSTSTVSASFYCSGTHTHSGPAGFLQYTLYQVTSLGFFEETMSAFAEGIAQSIKRYA
jgi:Neutral/alkaline non-lysosomal ceramidase, N-terminal